MITFITTIALLSILSIITLLVLERIISAYKQNNVLTEHIRTLLELAERTCNSMINVTDSFKDVLEKQNNTLNKILEDYSKKNN